MCWMSMDLGFANDIRKTSLLVSTGMKESIGLVDEVGETL